MHGRLRRWIIGLAAAAGLAGALPARAANENSPMMVFLGYYQLWQQYGAGLADGSNVSVSIVEAGLYPNTSLNYFSGKTMTKTSNSTSTDSTTNGHATIVGARFVGTDLNYSYRSVAPKTGASPNSSVQMYTMSQWEGIWFIEPGTFPNTPVPYGSQNNSRVSSHAYRSSDATLAQAARIDYTVQRDDYLHVMDSTQWSTQGNTFNPLIVAPAQGTTVKTAAVETSSVYTAGRVSPTVTGPFTGAGSDAIGQTAGVVSLLMSRGKTTTSNVAYTTVPTLAITGGTFSPYVKPGYVVKSGETSEVVKAAIMAGALRSMAAQGSPLDLPAIADYRVDVANRSNNGLDFRYGAGMVNAYNSYRIINAGETNSLEDSGLWQAGGISQYGFDYDIGFGGGSVSYNDANNNAATQASTNRKGTYAFTANAAGKFMASLVWNVKINGGSTPTSVFDQTATLFNMSLTLTDETTGTVVAQSASLVDNTQTIWTDLVSGHLYRMTVDAIGGNFGWDYGLAWRSEGDITATAIPEPATTSLLLGGAVLLLKRRRRA